jgi:hypothetical protein
VTWTQATANAQWPARVIHSSVVFDNKMWVMGGGASGGYLNDIWYSSDGVSWTQATGNADWSARGAHSSVVFDNKMWVIGGDDGSNVLNDVWYSTGLNGIEDNNQTLAADRFSIEVFPNPAKTYFSIRLPKTANHSEIKILDVTGKIVKSEELKGKNNRISLDGIKNGVYFIRIGDKTVKEKLVVTR